MADSDRGSVLAVHDKDLDVLLKDLGLLEAVEEHRINCEFCKRPITRENIGFIYFVDTEPRVCCDDIRCYEAILRPDNQ